MRGDYTSLIVRLAPHIRQKLRRMAVRAGITENDVVNVLILLADEERVADTLSYVKIYARRSQK